jgi:hypothetical protein
LKPFSEVSFSHLGHRITLEVVKAKTASQIMLRKASEGAKRLGKTKIKNAPMLAGQLIFVRTLIAGPAYPQSRHKNLGVVRPFFRLSSTFLSTWGVSMGLPN